jgi:ribose transport system substrate-binding protein
MNARQISAPAILATIVACGLLLTACGSSGDSATGAGAGGTKPKIAIVSLAGSEYFAGYNRGFEKAADELDLDVDIHNSPSLEVSPMAATINAAVATNPDYLIAHTPDSTALRQPLLTASERGIKVITYDTQVDEPKFVVTYVNADYHKYGERAGAELSRVIGGEGKVLLDSIIPGNEDLERLQEGFAEALAPGVSELPVQYSQGENGKASAIIRATLTREPDLAGITAASAYGGEGSIAALREAGKTGEVKAVLLSATKFAIDALRQGEVQVVVAEPLEDIGARAVRAAYEDANGKSLPEKIVLPLCTITKDTINDPKNQPCLQ